MSNQKSLTVHVVGTPAPQGSKSVFMRRNGRIGMKESSAGVRPWRDSVLLACREAANLADWEILSGPVLLMIKYNLIRPRGHYGKKGLRPSAPPFPDVKPDKDKLTRATCDGITESNRIYRDDAQVVMSVELKQYAPEGESSGAEIVIVDMSGVLSAPQIEVRWQVY